jgi:hypothetical protein
MVCRAEGLITASTFTKRPPNRSNTSVKTKRQTVFLGSDATRWGVKYEDVAGLCIPIITTQKWLSTDYSSIQLSPTWIAHTRRDHTLWVMVEIKCPYSKTLKDIPDEYAAQMLGQMACCELTECDFVVCRVRELSLSECEEMATTADVAVMVR